MEDQGTPLIQPMPFGRALFYFGIPALVALLVVYTVMPYLAGRGLSVFINYLVVYATLPMLALIGASVIAFYREGRGTSWETFKARFRLKPMDRKAWLWAIGLALFMILSAGLLTFTARWLASFDLLAPPEYWPAELKPSAQSGPGAGVPSEFLGVTLARNWWVLVVVLVSLVIATLGEELWWRGLILPRQELTHGKWTWVAHGLLWNAFHLFAPWNLLVILPGCLALSFVAQRLKNTWPGIIAHALANGLLVVLVVVLGIAS
jgi:membrane protease YdiL (CAAX protease family)